MPKYDKDKIKNQLDIQNIFSILNYLDAEPKIINENCIISKTICHNGDSHKLYYYDNTQLFQCYTNCGSFDIFELISKIKNCSLPQSMNFIVDFFSIKNISLNDNNKLEDWDILDRFSLEEDNEYLEEETIQLKEYDIDILKNYPSPKIVNWEIEGIDKNICDEMYIKYNPSSGSILIPHFDINNRLVGIRERTLVKDKEKYGKYRPANINNILYNHPLGFNLYGLNKSKSNISSLQIAVVVESEKSVLQYMSYFGSNNCLCVAVCGSNFSKYQLVN